MIATEDVTSPNFGFLAKRYPELERIAARSERYFSGDPIVSLITLRQFGEALAQLVAARSGLYIDPNERQRDLLRRLRVDGRYPSNVLGFFDQLRKDGNAAAHHHTGDHAKALECLKMARKLGIWFYRTFDNHNFRPRPFQPPRPPIDATTELTAELDRSRAQGDAALSARTGRMSLSRKYAFGFALAVAVAVAVIYAYVPLTGDDIAKLRWLD
jgi:type I restriction enzyme, R subunit